MPVRHFPLYTLFLLAAIAVAAATAAGPVARAQEPGGALAPPTSRWWYPMGNPEGTRSNIDATIEQDAVPPAIKWRVPILHNTANIAVGALLTKGGQLKQQQQVVGITGDTLLVLSGFGALERRVIYRDTAGFVPTPFQLTLTGLFNMRAGSTLLAGTPNAIGVGVDRAQRAANDSLWAFLADSAGKVAKKIVLGGLPQQQTGELRHAGLYPVAAFGKLVYVAVSQNDDRIPATGAVANALVLASYVSDLPFFENTKTQWSYPVGPRIFPQAPSLTYDALTNRNYVALSTTSYNASSRVTATPPASPPTLGRPTSSDSMYAINLSDTLARPLNVNTRPVPVLGAAPTGQERGESDSYFVTFYAAPGEGGTYFRAITENHDPSRPGTAKITLASAFAPDTATYGSYVDPEMADRGWTIATGDVDGGMPGRGTGLPNAAKFQNNQGEELIGARRNADGSDVDDNALYFFRWSYIDTALTGRPISLQLVFRQRFSGRLLAAGDLVGARNGDAYGRRELVVAHEDSVKVLQLLEYNDPDFGGLTEQYFKTIAAYKLDAPVKTAAIADLEGDGANDLIVTTERSTYAIGHPIPSPFGAIASDSARYCRGRQATVRWNRQVGGGEPGVRLTLIGGSGPRAIAYNYHSPSPDPLNPGFGRDSITIDTRGLTPGTYRLVVQDTIVAALTDTSGYFTIDQPLFENLALDTTQGVAFGKPFTLSASVDCSAGLWVVRSVDGGATWDTLKTLPVQLSGGTATAVDRIACPITDCSGGGDNVTVLYRFADTNRYGASEVKSVTIPIATRELSFKGTTLDTQARTQTVTWRSGDYDCGNPRIYLVDSAGRAIHEFAAPPAGTTEYTFTVPDELAGPMRVRICCSDNPCIFGTSSDLEIPKLSNRSYVAPNPFDPRRDRGGAVIVFRLRQPGNVTVTIYDAGRAVVRRLAEGVPHESGVYRIPWDGTNSQGDIVASGNYICIIESSSSEQPIVLPLIVNKH